MDEVLSSWLFSITDVNSDGLIDFSELAMLLSGNLHFLLFIFLSLFFLFYLFVWYSDLPGDVQANR